MANYERRSFTGVQLRAAAGENFVLQGIAASYDMPSKPIPGGPAGVSFTERIKPGAFKRSLRDKDDVKALFNHDVNVILGRVKNKTLALTDTDTGLAFRVALNPKSQTHKDLYASVQRGDIDECSFAFTVAPKGEKWNADYTQRTLTNVNLLDVSIVSNPAYGGNTTHVDARSAAQYVVTMDWRSKHERALAELALVIEEDRRALALASVAQNLKDLVG